MNLSELEAMTRAVTRLDGIDASDPEKAHSEADQVLLDVFTKVAPLVMAAYARVMGRAGWWASA